MELRILGPLEVYSSGGTQIDLGTPKQRAIIALLATRPGRVVPVQTLVDELWADEPPERAIASLQAYVSRLRRALEPGRTARDRSTVLVSRAPGYLLAVPPEAVDATRFGTVVEGFSDRDDPAVLSAALELWRGDPLPELGDSAFARAERNRLHELRFTAFERRSAAWLTHGRFAEVIYTTEAALAESPYREPLWAQLMLALYRAGRQADALQAYARARALLAGELGVEPGADLRRLEAEILRQSPALTTLPPPPAPPIAPRTAPPIAPRTAPPIAPGVAPHIASGVARPVVPGGGSLVDASPGAAVTVSGEAAVVGAERRRGVRSSAELVGRERELAVAGEVLSGRGRALVVEGFAGIGKSALLGEVRRRAVADGFLVGAGAGAEGAVFLPWAQILRGLADARPGDVAGAFAPFGNLPAVLDPGLAERIALPAAERIADAELARSLLYRGLVDGLRRLAGRVPVLLVFDDAHLLDRPSRTLLQLLVRDIAGTDIVVVLGVRSGGGVELDLPAVHLRLEGLPDRDVATLGARIAGSALDDETVAVLVDRTGGNPFFVRELLQVLLAEHALDAQSARERTPARVQEVLRRRFARLPGQMGAVLSVAAVLGREFDVAVLRDLTQLDELDLYDTLDTAVATGVLESDGGRLRFAHDLLRQAAYDENGPLRRARLHERAARALTGVAERAAHLRLALPVATPLEVAPALADAAAEAYQRTAHEESAALLHEALELLATAPAGQERDVAELDLRLRLAFMHQATDGYLAAPVAAQYERMEPILRRVRPTRAIRPALWGYASFHMTAGNADRVAAVARLDRLVADVHAGYLAHARGDLPAARELFQAALDALPPEGLAPFPVIDWDPVAGILGPAASAESLLGHRERAEELLARARRDTPYQEMYVSHYIACIAFDWRDKPAARAAAERSLGIARRIRNPEYAGMAQVLIGWARDDAAVVQAGADALGPTFARHARLVQAAELTRGCADSKTDVRFS
ncbi:BTAD domain-containing putative transcriptional regulator [Dactylosporangium sp. NPDC051541]|uniref:BTAD domain-containing putative transcriptional regulator n=1 Tax=Dactylosporangium sp. NPDC051541 TaxID=3363977 RepID=UPI0037975485